ncbi:MAG: insulinase family protein [Bacteroidales bacterium]|nr:insulinase family protein [Bacteroidales bacterium]
MEYQTYTLSNNIQLIHKSVESTVAHCCVMVDAGSRDEEKNELGLAHFIEHVIFKGTKKRNFSSILNRLEGVGADLNAYTTKEQTCVYASFLNKYYSRTLELFQDVFFNSIFPEEELKKEKDIIIDEIASYKDSPAEQIFEDFEDLIFHGHPIGRNILGTPKNVKKLNRNNIIDFIDKNYKNNKIIICSVGKIEFKKLIFLVEKYFGDLPQTYGDNKRKKFLDYKPVNKSIIKRNHQSHCIIGNIAYSIKDDRRIPLALLNNILGGISLNSRLNIGLREKHGIAYNIESDYIAYSDTGFFSVYLGTKPDLLEKSIELVYKEFDKLKEKKLGTLQLRNAKQQFIGQLAISNDSNLNKTLTAAKSFLVNKKVYSLSEISDIINAVTSEQLLDIANEIFDKDKLSTLIYKVR